MSPLDFDGHPGMRLPYAEQSIQGALLAELGGDIPSAVQDSNHANALTYRQVEDDSFTERKAAQSIGKFVAIAAHLGELSENPGLLIDPSNEVSVLG